MDDILHEAEQIATDAAKPYYLWLVGAVAVRWPTPTTCTVTNPLLSWAIASTKAAARASMDNHCREEYPAAHGWQVYVTCQRVPDADIAAIVGRLRITS